MINIKLYTLIAFFVVIIALYILNKLEDRHIFYKNKIFKYTVSFFIGAFWFILVPAIIIEFIIYKCCLGVSMIDWKSTFTDMWEQIKSIFKRKK